MKFILPLVAALALAAPAVADPFDTYAEALRAEQDIPGLSVAVIHRRKIVKLQGYGFADREARRPMTADTPMNIASISKPILGVQILRLADRRRLTLDADVNRWLPFRLDNPKLEGEVVTLRQLATHTSGVIDVDAEGETPLSDRPWALTDYLASVLTPGGAGYRGGVHFRTEPPGAVREYSNMGARLAGLAAERAGGAPLQEQMAREVFRPLGMTRTSWEARDYRPGVLAVRYDMAGCDPAPCASGVPRKLEPKPQNANTNYPDGGVHSSARDLSRLALALLNGGRSGGYAMLSDEAFREMLRPQLTTETRQRFFWRERDGMIGHMGSDYGVFTSLYFDPATGDAFVVLMNRTPDARTERAMGELVATIRAMWF